MYQCTRNYIGGEWIEAGSPERHPIINPATEASIGHVAYGTSEDVDRAVRAARSALATFAGQTVAERVELLEAISAALKARLRDIGAAISAEMGAPATFARRAQAGSGIAHLQATAAALKSMPLEEPIGASLIVREPIGVCGLITPWNWPINQIACKVAPALAAGCTVVLKPSEIAPVNAMLFAEVMHEAGVPAGVFNLVQGDGPGVGTALAEHPDIDMVSFTGSTRAGVLVARAAAESVKRVAQELGGKSPNIIMEGAPLEEAVTSGARMLFDNSGQSCNAPSRMLVPASRYEEAVAIAAAVAKATRPGDPQDPATDIGPVVSQRQFDRIQALIEAGIAEGAVVAAGGPGRPTGLERGFYVRPTVFRDVDNGMTIAQEEIFGPVLVMIPYGDIEEAIAIANDTPYGLSSYVWGGTAAEAMDVARRLRSGMVHLNGADTDIDAPFGGYRKSGNGREWGRYGIEEFMEIKAVMGG
ncbi:MAG: aldehyde dehydrogenase family protein [Xanthomonadales bacterium]